MHMTRMKLLAGLLFSLMLAVTPALAADENAGLLTVDAVLAALADTAAESAGDTSATDRVAAFRAELADFGRELPALSDAAAARRWNGLFKTFLRLEAQPAMRAGQPARPLEMDELWDVLPPPGAWPGIAADSENESLRLIGAVLTNDRDAMWRAVQAAAAVRPGGQDYERMQQREALSELLTAYCANCDDPDSLAAALDLHLRLLEELAKATPEMRGYYQELKLPDVAAILSPAKAEEIIRRALRLPRMLEEPAGGETRRLAMRLALTAETGALAAPQWQLAAAPDGFDLYERCAAQFPAKGAEWQRGSARAYYVFGLAARGRMAEAVADADKLLGSEHYLREPGKAMVRDGHAAAARQFLRELLTRQPNLDLWDMYAERTSEDGQGAEFIALAERTLADSPTLPNRAHIARHLFTALLATERLAAAGELVAQAVAWSAASPGTPESPAEDPESPDGDMAIHVDYAAAEEQAEYPNLGILLNEFTDTVMFTDTIMFTADSPATELPDEADEVVVVDEDVASPMSIRERIENLCALGEAALAAGELLQEKPDSPAIAAIAAAMVENGLRIMRAAAAGYENNSLEVRLNVARHLLRHNRLAAAQAEVIAIMRAKGQARRAAEQRFSMQAMAGEELLLLADIYQRAGQWQQVLALFDTAPVWPDSNIQSILWRYTQFNAPAAHTLASALAQAGRRDEALLAVRYLLACAPGSDSGYALLLELNPPDPGGFLAALYARDQFEERPLIWQAILLAKQGDLAAAEAAVRKAIEIDPTDGDQQPGNRVLAYATLRDILLRRGDTATAAIYASLVTSVREAEEADRWRNAGFAARALGMYAVALGHFADAYCIQARLAMQLGRAGRTAEAAEHFQRAFELLPGQVGRMEQLCFGCEHTFGGEAALPIADAVFSRLHREQPANPRVAYLLGNLRVEQERYAEAAALYRIAVTLDSEYLNAWEKLSDLNGKLWLPAGERQEIVRQLARLNPTGSHVRFSGDDVGDPALAWRLAEAMARTRQDTFVYQVHAAPRPEPAASDPQREYLRSLMQFRGMADNRYVPRLAVRELPVMRALDSWLQLMRNRRMMSSTIFHRVIY